MEFSNRIRYYRYIAGVFANQQSDPMCGICKAFTNSVRNVREDLAEFERQYDADMKSLPPELSDILSESKKILAGLKTIEDAVGQKKAGNCKMPEGVCYVKLSKSILEKIS
ncbi:MAG: hypothetical protein M1147_05515 [Nitrospirae bacterium]|nr:hypothetical protein [Nitrospirota bacterium]MCL5977577.1 hypothetical protein [Nitrospirota bacterium]